MDEERLRELFDRMARGGDEAAETELFDELRPRLTAIAFGRHVYGADADDVVQECLKAVFVQLRRGKFDARSQPSTWVIGILLKKVVDHFRKGRRADALLAAAASEIHLSIAHVSRQARQETRLQVMEGLARLTPIERIVLIGTVLWGLTYKDVAARLRCPEGTVASTKHRAVAKFLRFLRGQQPLDLEGGGDDDV
jgi:RNA polymerase sigma-70 factor (ECF subfamily)